MRQAFREALSTFDSKNAILERLDGFRYDNFYQARPQVPRLHLIALNDNATDRRNELHSLNPTSP